MKARSVVAEGPGSVSVKTEELPPPGKDEVLVQSLVSALSPGTETKFVKGQHTHGSGTFAKTDPIGQKEDFPFGLGYSVVGRISEVGSEKNGHLIGKNVFAYHPHCSSFVIDPSKLILLPDDSDPERFALYANMETAVTLIMDGKPMMGEEVMVLGQGVVGLLLTDLLSGDDLSDLVTVEKLEYRREISMEMGADLSLPPEDLDPEISKWGGFDLIYEVTGRIDSIDIATKYSGHSGRIIIGSYYGDMPGKIRLGDGFHRKRLRIKSSQVSTIDPGLSGRWSRDRRSDLTMRMLKRLNHSRLITHRFGVEDAVDAYETLLSEDDDHLQILLEY
mgnify:FL=1